MPHLLRRVQDDHCAGTSSCGKLLHGDGCTCINRIPHRTESHADLQRSAAEVHSESSSMIVEYLQAKTSTPAIPRRDGLAAVLKHCQPTFCTPYSIITTVSNKHLNFLRGQSPVILEPGSEELKCYSAERAPLVQRLAFPMASSFSYLNYLREDLHYPEKKASCTFGSFGEGRIALAWSERRSTRQLESTGVKQTARCIIYVQFAPMKLTHH